LFGYLSRQSSNLLADKIERHSYNEKDLVEIKLVLHLPYYDSQDEYESFEGEVTINGNHYNYVKRKVFNDTLFLMCLPNKEKDQLQTAKNDYGKTVNDLGGEKKNENTAKKETDYSPYHFYCHEYTFTPPEANAHKQASFVNLFVPVSFIDWQEIPPELMS